MEQHIKIGEGGRLIIPVAYRKALSLKVGDELILRLEDGELRLFQQKHAIERIRDAFRQNIETKKITDDFLSYRKHDESDQL